MREESTITINTEKLKEAINKTGFNATKIAEEFLGKNQNYIHNCYARGRIGEEEFKKLCRFFSWKKEDFLIIREEPKTEEAGTKQLSTDWIVVGLNKNHEEHLKTNALLAELLQQIKATNAKLSRMEAQLHSVENANGRCVSAMIQMQEEIKTQGKNVTEIRNTCALLQGRVNDIRLSVEKPSAKKYA